MRKCTQIALAALAVLLAGPVASALAQEHHEDFHGGDRDRHFERGRGDHHDFHGHDFRFFTPFELGLWRGGGWHHDWHDGRFGWWWVTDGYWYWYPEPVYPYPSYVPPVAPPVVVVTPGAPPPPPPAPVYAPPPPPPPPAAGQAPSQFWYYCDESKSYYPYVSTCNTPWRQVPANH